MREVSRGLTSTAPAARRRATAVPSRVAGGRPRILAGGEAPVDRLGVGEGRLAEHGRERIERAIALRDPLERAGHDLARARLARAHGGGDRRRRRGRVDHGSKRQAGSVVSGSGNSSTTRTAASRAARCCATAAREPGGMVSPMCAASRSTSVSSTRGHRTS